MIFQEISYLAQTVLRGTTTQRLTHRKTDYDGQLSNNFSDHNRWFPLWVPLGFGCGQYRRLLRSPRIHIALHKSRLIFEVSAGGRRLRIDACFRPGPISIPLQRVDPAALQQHHGPGVRTRQTRQQARPEAESPSAKGRLLGLEVALHKIHHSLVRTHTSGH